MLELQGTACLSRHKTSAQEQEVRLKQRSTFATLLCVGEEGRAMLGVRMRERGSVCL